MHYNWYMNTLPELIKLVGEKAFAEAIGKSEYTAQAYRYKRRTPSGKTAKKILSVYGKLITYEGIYGKSK
jgi:hypothetical protein